MQSKSPSGHFSPLRYPGGKGKLAEFLKEIITSSGLEDGEYVEPFAGGAGIAIELLMQEYVRKVWINDISLPIYSFWHSVLEEPEALCRLIRDTRLSVRSWEKQRSIFQGASASDLTALGFATFFLNRTNRSGILNGGMIGGKAQAGQWKMDARYNKDALIKRIQNIANMKARVSLSMKDAAVFIRHGKAKWSSKTLIYFDPPYYVKGRHLYHDFYRPDDHAEIAKLASKITRQKWIVSYDNVPEIRDLYSTHPRIVYNVGYSARTRSTGTEVMFFGPDLAMPKVRGSMVEISRRYGNSVRAAA